MAPEALQRAWRSLVKLFPAVTLPWDMFFDAGAWRMIGGSDFLPSVYRNSKSRKAAALLSAMPPDFIEPLAEMARINAHRTGDFFKTIGVCYVSLPLALGAFLSDAAPEFLNAYVTSNINDIAVVLFVLITTPIWYFLSHYRAKQLAWTIDLYRAGAIEPKPATK